MGLKTLREKAGLIQAQLADKTGISQQMVSEHERRTRKINTRAAQAYAKLFGMSVDAFLIAADQPDVEESIEESAPSLRAAPDRDSEWRAILQTIADAMKSQAIANAEQSIANRKALETIIERVPEVSREGDRQGSESPPQAQPVVRPAR